MVMIEGETDSQQPEEELGRENVADMRPWTAFGHWTARRQG